MPTSAETIPKENSIADKQISYANPENGTTDNIDFKRRPWNTVTVILMESC